MSDDLFYNLVNDLKKKNFAIDLSDRNIVKNYKVNSNKFKKIINRLIDVSTLVERYVDEEYCECNDLYYYDGIYFIHSGGGISNEVLESCTQEQKEQLLKKWKKNT